MNQLSQSPQPSSSLIKKSERKKHLQHLASLAKSSITSCVTSHQQSVQTKHQSLLNAVDLKLLDLLETLNSSSPIRSDSNINQTIDDNLLFSPIQKQLEDFLYPSSTTPRSSSVSYNNNLVQKLQLQIEECMIKEQRLSQELKELKRKYRAKHPNNSVSGLSLPSVTVLSTRYQRENKMLMEQNNTLSNQLIQMQCDTATDRHCSQNIERNSDLKVLDTCESVRNQSRQIEVFQKELIELRSQLSNSNQKLLENQHKIYQTKRLLQVQTQRTECQTQRNTKLSLLISDYKNKITTLEQTIQHITSQTQSLAEQNESLHFLQKDLVRKQILTDIVKQLTQQSQTNKFLSNQVESLKSKLTLRQNQMRDKQIHYIEKLDEYSLISKRNYDQLLEKHTKESKSNENYSHVISQLKTKLSYYEQSIRNKEESALQLESELEETKSNLKQLKKTTATKKSVAKKEEERGRNEERLMGEIRCYEEEIGKFKMEYKMMREGYGEKVGLLQARIRGMKERFSLEVIGKLQRGKQKQKVGKGEITQIAENLVESFNNLVHKQSMINRLNKELNQLKSKKQKQKQKNLATTSRLNPQQTILHLNSQLHQQRLKVQKSNFEEKTNILQQKLLKSQVLIKDLQLKLQQSSAKQTSLNNKISTLQKQLKQKKNEPVESNNDKFHEQQIEEWKGKYNELRKSRDDLQLEVKIKKEALAHMKSTMKIDQSQYGAMKKSNEELKQECEKLRKNVKEYQRKEQGVKEMKQKVDSIKVIEKENNELKMLVQERTKQYKQQLSKKDFVIKLQKQKEKQMEQKLKLKDYSTIQIENNEIRNLEEILQKEKVEIERKDSLIKVYKQKIQKLEQKVQRQQLQFQQKSNQIKGELIKQNKKVEQFKFDIKKNESDIFLMRGLMKKIYNIFKEFAAVDGKSKNKNNKKSVKQIQNLEMFSEGLSILNLNVQEIHDFLPGNQDVNQIEDRSGEMKLLIGKLTELAPAIKEAIQ